MIQMMPKIDQNRSQNVRRPHSQSDAARYEGDPAYLQGDVHPEQPDPTLVNVEEPSLPEDIDDEPPHLCPHCPYSVSVDQLTSGIKTLNNFMSKSCCAAFQRRRAILHLTLECETYSRTSKVVASSFFFTLFLSVPD